HVANCPFLRHSLHPSCRSCRLKATLSGRLSIREHELAEAAGRPLRQRESTLEHVDELRPRYPDLLGELGLCQTPPPAPGLDLEGDGGRQDMAREMRQAGHGPVCER